MTRYLRPRHHRHPHPRPYRHPHRLLLAPSRPNCGQGTETSGNRASCGLRKSAVCVHLSRDFRGFMLVDDANTAAQPTATMLATSIISSTINHQLPDLHHCTPTTYPPPPLALSALAGSSAERRVED